MIVKVKAYKGVILTSNSLISDSTSHVTSQGIHQNAEVKGVSAKGTHLKKKL